jgi:hypothetical protein
MDDDKGRLVSYCTTTQEKIEMEGNAWRWTDRCSWGFIAVSRTTFLMALASVKPLFDALEGRMEASKMVLQSDTTESLSCAENFNW